MSTRSGACAQFWVLLGPQQQPSPYQAAKSSVAHRGCNHLSSAFSALQRGAAPAADESNAGVPCWQADRHCTQSSMVTCRAVQHV